MTTSMAEMLIVSGVLAMGYAVAALFFVRFWHDTGERLFLYFGLAFAMLTIQRLTLALAINAGQDTIWSYVLRLAAFALLLAGIVEKNRGSSSAASS